MKAILPFAIPAFAALCVLLYSLRRLDFYPPPLPPKVVVFSKASPLKVVLPSPGSISFEIEGCRNFINNGSANTSIESDHSTINGASSFVLKSNEQAVICNDGENYYVQLTAPPKIVKGTK